MSPRITAKLGRTRVATLDGVLILSALCKPAGKTMNVQNPNWDDDRADRQRWSTKFGMQPAKEMWKIALGRESVGKVPA